MKYKNFVCCFFFISLLAFKNFETIYDNICKSRNDKSIRFSLYEMELRRAMKKRKTRARLSLRHRRFGPLLRRAAKIQRLCYAVVYAF